jgi:hypothetical protein
VDVAPVDLICQVYVVPQGVGTFNGDTLAYNVVGSTTISGDYVLGRSYDVAAAQMTISKPVMTVKAVGFDSALVDITATDENNNPIEAADALVYQNSLRGNLDYMVVPYKSTALWTSVSVPTNADGFARSTLIAVAKNYVVTQASVKADVYGKASEFGAISLFAQNSVVMHVAQAYVTLDSIQDTQKIGDKISVSATVKGSTGAAVAGIPVELSAGAGATVTQGAMATDATGKVTFELDTSAMNDLRAAFIPVQAKAGGVAYEVGLAIMAIPVMNEGPTISVLSPAAGGEVVKTAVVMTASVSDQNGVQTVKVTVDGGTTVTVQGTAGETTWDIAQALGDLSKGDHSVKVNATDSLGISTETTVSFSAVNEAGGTSMAIWGALVAGWVVAAIVAVLWLMRKPKSPEAATVPEPPKVE